MLLDSTRLLFDLQQVNQIVESFASCLAPEAIAQKATAGLVEKFGCAFARIWIVEPDRQSLRMIASAGLYPRTDGSFARVPMGAFKIGKIAQNCIPFLSNRLAEETWVKDREWAIAKGICGFAGYPLVINGRVIGVLAAFSYQPMPAEFIEVLQLLCTPIAVALENALLYQREKQNWQSLSHSSTPLSQSPLSEQLANLLQDARFILMGTEQQLTPAIAYLLLQVAERLRTLGCAYCRLTYAVDETVSLEAVIPRSPHNSACPAQPIASVFEEFAFAFTCLGGMLQIRKGERPGVTELFLKTPNRSPSSQSAVGVCCQSPLLQIALTQMAYLAGLTVCPDLDASVPLLTDQPARATSHPAAIWIATSTQPTPPNVKARVDLSISPEQLQAAVEAVSQGETWGVDADHSDKQFLSGREQEILMLLAQGLRDRDIANKLYISERTVKFHINNLITKLNANTRVQALHEAIRQGWVASA
ncbi:LuxR C-terminal-related transcriptional regulator [Oculatella sp. FACHB-28]|uniref:LuxR C-terminal-related transcriptional regulator n=1 Tax=Oculatella sp. FACHB-28 TaxID=2692845 RepID=UPI00321FCC1E